AARLEAEAARLRAAVPADPDPAVREATQQPTDQDRRMADLQRRRRELAEEVEAARGARRDSERRRAQADAAVGLAERQLAAASRGMADLAEREGALEAEREDLVSLLARGDHEVAAAESTLAAIVQASASQRERLQAAESSVTAARERLRVAQDRVRLDEREDVEARLALEGL